TAGADAVAVKRGIDLAVEAATDSITAQAKKVRGTEDLRKVATVSANWDAQIGSLLAEAFEQVGKDGVTTSDEGKGTDNTLEAVGGMEFDKGFVSAYCVTSATRMEAVREAALILIHEKRISSLRDLI